MFYYCTKINMSLFFAYIIDREEWTHTRKKKRKRIGVLCVVVIIYTFCNILFSSYHLFTTLAPLSRSLPVATQIRGHIAGAPPPSPLWHVPSFLSREEVIIFFLPSSTRVELYLPTLLGALSSVDPHFSFNFANKIKYRHGVNRTQGQANVSSIRG